MATNQEFSVLTGDITPATPTPDTLDAVLARIDGTLDGLSARIDAVSTEAPPKLPLKLLAKLVRVAAAINEVPKNGQNKEHGYKYATADDVMAAVRRPMHEAGVFLMPRIVRVDRGAAATRSGSANRTELAMEYLFIDTESGESWSLVWEAEANDIQDKGLSKALTTGIKYALRQVFMISTGDLADEIDHEERGARPEQGPRSEQRRRQPREAGDGAPGKDARIGPPLPQRKVSARGKVMIDLQADLQRNGCEVVGSEHPMFPKYQRWMIGAFAQLLGRDVERISTLTDAEIVDTAPRVLTMVKAGEYPVWTLDIAAQKSTETNPTEAS